MRDDVPVSLRPLLVILFIVALVPVVALAARGDSAGPIRPGGDPKEFVERIDAVIDVIARPGGVPKHPQDWANEITPYFEYEGVVRNPVRAKSIKWENYPDARGHMHILGQASCDHREIWLNARVVNPVSPWRERWSFLGTLTHELAHVQGICGLDPLVETSAQLVTFEVLAAMANHGNKWAAVTLLHELREIALGAVYAKAIREKDVDGYQRFTSRIYDDPWQDARSRKSARYWRDDPAELGRILEEYEERPYQMLVKGFKLGYIEGVALPTTEIVFWGSQPKTTRRILVIDDLIDFLAHVEWLFPR